MMGFFSDPSPGGGPEQEQARSGQQRPAARSWDGQRRRVGPVKGGVVDPAIGGDAAFCVGRADEPIFGSRGVVASAGSGEQVAGVEIEDGLTGPIVGFSVGGEGDGLVQRGVLLQHGAREAVGGQVGGVGQVVAAGQE